MQNLDTTGSDNRPGSMKRYRTTSEDGNVQALNDWTELAFFPEVTSVIIRTRRTSVSNSHFVYSSAVVPFD